jgi:hypothetical protein
MLLMMAATPSRAGGSKIFIVGLQDCRLDIAYLVSCRTAQNAKGPASRRRQQRGSLHIPSLRHGMGGRQRANIDVRSDLADEDGVGHRR